MRFAQTNFPGKAGVLDGSERRRTGAAIVSADGDNVGASFGDACGDDADAGAGHEFDADAGAGVDGAQIVDELSEIFDAVDIVVRRRRNQRSARCSVADARDIWSNFFRRELTTFTGL